ncbi:MAG TPA: hypothetical protein VGO30_26910 [Mycobacterium sp.]|jgi:hypothetical protein|nr:hypothetical protein [Mycobacterium sp.]
MSSTNRRNVKVFAVIIGGSAVVALGAMNAAFTHEHAGQDVAKGTTMTIGATSTETTPPTAPAVGEAAPSIKGPAPLPSEEQGLP